MTAGWKWRVNRVVRGLVAVVGLGLLFGNSSLVSGQSPAYPRVNLATSYQVDPTWPQRPAGMEWGGMPGVAVDRQDRVWIFTRAKPPVQVYDARGKFLFGWGEDLVGVSHQIRFDPQGNVWLADVGKHVVMQCTPDGKLLKTLGTPGEAGDDERHLNKPTDYCVKFTALDAVALGFHTHVIQDACRGVNLSPGDVVRAINQMREAGVKIVDSIEISGRKRPG